MVNKQRFNLVPADRIEKNRRQAVQRGWIIGCSGYLLFLGIVFIVAHGVLLSDDHAARDELTRLVKRVELGQQKIDKLQREVASVQGRTTANRSIAGQPDWGLIMAILADSLDEQLVLTSCQIDQEVLASATQGSAQDSADGNGSIILNLAGLGRTQQAVLSFVLRLEEHPLFREVNLVNTRREPFGGEFAVGFVLRCRLQAVDREKEQAS